VGAGTGTFACLLARRGIDVVAVDPAAASLVVARAKPGAEAVRWIQGGTSRLPTLQVDLAIMTGNVAQVFIHDDEWVATLSDIRAAVRPNGRVVFETRDPAAEGWRGWNRQDSYRRMDIPNAGIVESWVDTTEVRGPLVSFRWTFAFEADGAVLTSDSTLRFRSRDEVETSLAPAGLVLEEVRDAPDRPGLEMVFISTRPGS
jgi:SAM-dependent methyltransferase